MIATKRTRIIGAAMLAATIIGGVSACSGGSGSGSSSSAGGTYTFWDPYPQFDASAAWTKLVEQCGTQAGVTVKRTGYDTSALTNKALLAAQQGNSPDVLIVDNPVVSTLADAGVLTDTTSTTGIEPNLLA
ncbi:MAG TPA: extracellular solute-binding protein, partial [Pseudolysinimonas sp.]